MKRISSLMLLPLASAVFAQESPKKNLVVIMVDQWRGNAFGYTGKEAVKTPNLDKLARRSVNVRQCISGYPVSSPARAMFLTGAYPWSNGVPANCNSETALHDVELSEELETWSDILKSQNYATGYIGKWHLDKPFEPFIDTYNNRGKIAWNEWCPPERRHGFDYWVAYGTYDYHTRPMYWVNPSDRDDWKYFDQWGPEFEADRAIEFIQANENRPFALMVSINPPHTGYELVPEKYKDVYRDLDVDSVAASRTNVTDEAAFFKRSLPDYYACMTGVDEQVGRILDEIDERGLRENTVVMFTSDHGDMMGTHNHRGKNIFYEEAVHIPMFIAGAGLTPRTDETLLMSLEDVCPTLLSMMGYGERIPATSQGVDLSRQIKGESFANKTGQLYMRTWYCGEKEVNNARGWRDGRYTYATVLENGAYTREVLFDRQSDPYQLNNIISKYPDIAGKMRNEMTDALYEAGDPLFQEENRP